jgi:DNA-binding CsgD family transcriptional regulator
VLVEGEIPLSRASSQDSAHAGRLGSPFWNNARVNPGKEQSHRQRLLETLERLLSIETVGVFAALQQGAEQLAEVLRADKVDVFLLTADEDELVAVGTSPSRMSQRQHALGLDRLPLTGGGLIVRTFITGRSYVTGHADHHPDELEAVWRELRVRASMGVRLQSAGQLRGVLLASSETPEAFTEGDLQFLEAVGRWITLLGERAANVERLAAQVAEESLRSAAVEVISVLTPRQQEVAALIAEGLTNEQIAARLVLVPGTVANHVGAILDRLDVRSRSEIAVWAIERGLLLHNEPPEEQP